MAEKSSRFDRYVSSNLGYGAKAFSIKNLIPFTEQLVAQIRLKKTLNEALETIYELTGERTLRMMLMSISTTVKAGNPMSQGMLTFKDMFPNFYVAAVMGVERSGKIIPGLEALIDYLKNEKSIIDYLNLILFYARMIIFNVLLVLIILLVQMGVIGLAPLSIALMTGIIVVALSAGTFLQRFLASESPNLRRERTLIALPVIGSFHLQSLIAKFCFMFNTFHKAGIPFLQNFELLVSYMHKSVIYPDLLILLDGLQTKDEEAGQEAVEAMKFIPKSLAKEFRLFQSGQTKLDSIGIFGRHLNNSITQTATKLISTLRATVITSSVLILSSIYLLIII